MPFPTHLLQGSNNFSTLGSLCTFMCVHTFRSWASMLSITNLGPIPMLGPPAASNFVSTPCRWPLATARRTITLNQSIGYTHSFGPLHFLKDIRIAIAKSSEELRPRPAIVFVSVPRPYLLQTTSNKGRTTIKRTRLMQHRLRGQDDEFSNSGLLGIL